MFLFTDKSVRVTDNLDKKTEFQSQAEQRPRPPVTATEIPSRPQPSPSPVKTISKRSPAKQLEMQDSFNPLLTAGVTTPQNTPEKKSKVWVLLN